MKINNIFRVGFLLALVTIVTTGCRFEEEDLFETSANLRQEYANRDIKKVLCSASENDGNGWVFQYFVAGNDDTKYPGFNLFCKFYDSGKVIIGGDHQYMKGGLPGKYMESDSFYEMKKDEANTLAFTTWNNVLTPFVNPDNSGEGMHGDCDLVVMSWNEDEITFRGTRHSARSRLVRLDRTPEQYISDVTEMNSQFQNGISNPYIISKGSSSSYIVKLNTGRLNLIDRVQDPLSREEMALVFTPNGFYTERSMSSLDGSFSFHELVYDQSRDCFVDKEDNEIVVDVVYKSDVEAFINGMAIKMYGSDLTNTWNFDEKSDISDDLKADINAIKKAYTSLKEHKFAISYDVTAKKFTITLSCKLSTVTKKYPFHFDYQIANDVITLSNPVSQVNLSSDSAGKKIKDALESFMNNFVKSFKVEYLDSKWSRKNAKMVSADGTTYVNLK